MNLPNILASLRILLAPLLFFVLTFKFEDIHSSWINYFATLIFGVAALTDFFDGYIARAWGQKTKLGAILDPLADKMLLLAAFLGLLLLDRANAWVVYLILVREFFITGFRVVMQAENIDISASFAGKLKTAFQMIAVIFLMMEWIFGEALLYLALILTLYSGLEYILIYLKHKQRINK
ncbi:CDP-diacylglycerol--glycerol-3-phosphate 3-phosphatidyltransferase [Campylobacter sp. MIT 97-5078]|uniref:CDP-diacylglycerol--glycerol-3-phosphate 3-phosphatidyltransferase n=1 Tax=Campylobacter sp. MIT 97-5078 TaxID=1548153 RepID=UPI0005141C77|nr:CDP-diacylglycerol--glycerol-3-phosphate 3-phosphatidyltransferase [Campylobacter sp. MIT 97-5078]KGI57378.1 CDP-diacylglycerol--glycerol-3-phosphate 3-phosphatidyltransferase [Campylobacter sp. MIT 97-5078]TQR28283.1 CDP-diacylglycerol--glycerol-3-phosphate 3-phosphatidyltransferase [Campylobacter sp. MIT 97-5078]